MNIDIFLGNNKLNFTSYLIYERPNLSLDDRDKYKTAFQISMICGSCKEGYYLDKQ